MRYSKWCLVLLLFTATALGENMKVDPHSHANIEEARVTNVSLELDINFEDHVLNGSVTLSVERVKPETKSIFLDSLDLNIHRVLEENTGQQLDFFVGDPVKHIGSKVEVIMPVSNESSVDIRIHYTTTNNASALVWLTKEQTAGKTHPYLFSVCEPYSCRSMVPLQDTPAIKSPYTARITAPADMTVLMSAIPQGKPEMVEDGKRKLYQFQQPIPIPSYLIAIAAGNLEARKIGPRSHVWSEPEVVDAAASKLDDTEDLLKIAEELSGPYIWGIYDILVLPPSFAYSGMENPCLTFISPHILQGEKAHVKLMAHEIAHSWTGNLVTNKNFEHFWINEGFTMFVGRRIQGLVSGGRAMESLEALGDWKQLENYVNEVVTDDHPLTSLVVNLTGLNPHDSFNPIPYHKGSVFLWYLEGIVGGPAIMETFLKSYYKSFAYKSIDSTEFKGYFENYFKNETKINSIDWDTWLNGRGMPPYRPNYDESLSQACKDLAQKWINLDTDVSADLTTSNREWTILSPEQKREFMSVLLAEKEPLSVEKLQLMDELYQLNGMKHWEIRSRWIRLGLKGHWDHAIPRAVEMVSEGGDIMLTIGPIYRDMYDWEKAREAALEAFEKNRSSMMKVAVHSVMKDLKISESES